MKKITTKHGDINFPAFMPDATYGSIKSLSFADTKKAGINEIVTTTLHLEQKIGSLYIKKIGGLHKFFNWDRPILTDSGGWQVFSLINAKKNTGNKISELGCSFVDPTSGKSSLLTPESSIQIQFNLDSDIITVLDDPIVPDATLAQRKESIKINTIWAKRSKSSFLKLSTEEKPLIGCVIQGAEDFALRKISADELLEIDFDLYNFGGIPVKNPTTWKDEVESGLYKEMLHFVSSCIPNTKVKYAMGIGKPEDISFCIDVGWHLFDTVLPTRNARHGYLFVSKGSGDVTKTFYSNFLKKTLEYDILHIKSERYKFDSGKIDTNCNCECCEIVSKNYLRHLIRIKESAGIRLSSIHNLTFYSNFLKQFQGE